MNKLMGYAITGAVALAALWLVANMAPANIAAAFGLNPPVRRLF
jgi:hypothetical protein